MTSDLDPIDAQLRRDATGFITYADEAVTRLLGWAPDELVGQPSTELIHPGDQASAVAAWMTMIPDAGASHVWRGRYRSAGGTWVWVETTNTNLLEDPGVSAVVTTMRAVAADGLSLEEQLRTRVQLLDQLSDALPVGLVHFDLQRNVVFTNDRLHVILDRSDVDSIDGLFSEVVTEDRDAFEGAINDVLGGSPVDDVEIRSGADGTAGVFSLSLRSLTDNTGEVNGAIGCLLDVTDRARLRSQLVRRASTDALTGCANRATIIDTLRDHLQDIGDHPGGLCVIFVDVDRFKQVNDTYGHDFGDRVLAVVVQRLAGALRGIDRLGRLGGDEFLAVCPAIDGPEAAKEIGDRVARKLHGTFSDRGTTIDLDASVGVAFQDRPTSPDALIARADQAMYEAKTDRRTDSAVAPPPGDDRD